MSAHNFGRVYLLAMMFVVVGGIGGCDTDDLVTNLGAVHGVVLDGQGEPISSTMVTVTDSSYSALTNGEGRYVLNLPAGEYNLTASKEGFQSLTQPVVVGAKSGQSQLDFTLTTGQSKRIELRLTATKEFYEAGDVVPLTLTIKNVSQETVALLDKGFFAQDGMGNVVWRIAHELQNVELSPGETKRYTGNWDWYTSSNAPVTIGASFSCYGLVHLVEGDPEIVSAPVRVTLIGPKPEPSNMPFETVAHGDDCSILERRGFVIRSEDDWTHFWEKMGKDESKPVVDFSKDVVVAAIGGGTNAAQPKVEIAQLQRVLPYRTASGVIAPLGKIICSINQHFCTGVIDCKSDTAVHSPFHIVVTPKFAEQVDFQWLIVRTTGNL